MRIASIIGARPQFVKAGAVSRKLRREHEELLVHTGQHFDDEMSAVFFRELDLPRPDRYLDVGSGTHAVQTGTMLMRLEQVFAEDRFDAVLVYGDTNSTLAGALAAAKMQIPVVHVEAGLRSFNMRMPEEQNRRIVDHLSSLLLCPSETAVRQLAREGIERGVHEVGDVMGDVLQLTTEAGVAGPERLEPFGVEPGDYLFATVHRAENTDDPEALGRILRGLSAVEETVLFPVHPRTRKALEKIAWQPPDNVRPVEPMGYLDAIACARHARLVLTDSGGLQKEAYWLGVPCVTLREETEWVETVDRGWNRLVGTDVDEMVKTVREFRGALEHPPLYGAGLAVDRSIAALDGLE